MLVEIVLGVMLLSSPGDLIDIIISCFKATPVSDATLIYCHFICSGYLFCSGSRK